MPPPNAALIDTSAYGDSYINNSVARGVTLYDPVASDSAAGRQAILGFYGKTLAGVNHPVAKIQTTSLADETRKGALQVMLNAGSAGADQEFEAFKVDATGALALQYWDAAANAGAGASASNVSVSAAGVMAVRTQIDAPVIDAASQLVGPHFLADAADEKVLMSSGANQFLVDFDQNEVSTNIPSAFTKNVTIGADASMKDTFTMDATGLAITNKTNAQSYLQFKPETDNFAVQLPRVDPTKSHQLKMAAGKVEMINNTTSLGLTVDHETPQVKIDYAMQINNDLTVGSSASPKTLTVYNDAVIHGNLTVNGSTTTIESTTVTVADKTIELSKTATPTSATAIGGGFEVAYPTANKTFLYAEPTSALASFSANVGLNIPTNYGYQINGAEVLTKDFVNVQQATGAYKISGTDVLNASQLILAPDASSEASMQCGNWRLRQKADGDFYVEKYNGTAWVTKAKYI